MSFTSAEVGGAPTVQFLRLVRNCRLPPPNAHKAFGCASAASVAASPTTAFSFCGLETRDAGDFGDAEAAWENERHNDASFHGPLHLVLVCDGEPVERWSVTDFAPPGAAGRDDHEALAALTRLVYAYAVLHPLVTALGQKRSPLSWVVYTSPDHPLHIAFDATASAGIVVSKQWSHMNSMCIRVDSVQASVPLVSQCKPQRATPSDSKMAADTSSHDAFMRAALLDAEVMAAVTGSDVETRSPLSADVESILDACRPLLEA